MGYQLISSVALQATLGHMFNTTEEAISSPVPSQEGSLAAYSPSAQQESQQGFLPLPGHMAHHMPDFNSLYESPAGGASEILVLEGRDGSHVNLTQSRFSRFASETNGSLNPFELTSRAFRNSSADQALQLSGYSSSSAQHMLAGAGASYNHTTGVSLDSDLISTAYRRPSSLAADDKDQKLLGQSTSIGADSAAQTARRQSSSIAADGTAQTAAALEAITARQQQSRTQVSYGSYDSLQMSSQASAGLPAMSKGEVSSHRAPQQQHHSFNGSAAGYRGDAQRYTEVAGSSSHTPESAPVGLISHHHQTSPSSNYGRQAFDSPELQDSWAGLDDSVAGSVHSPGQESLHSYVESTPARQAAGFEAGTPEHRKLASNFARLASAAALAKSPGLAAAGKTAPAATQLSEPLLNPEMRTPRTFFNPSFDNHHEESSP